MERRFPFNEAPPEEISFFELFGISASLALDDETLRVRFYELSRETHPDKCSGPHAVGWSALINKAYQTLRDPIKRSHYLIDLYRIPTQKNPPIPIELAESYFELQDADAHQLPRFQTELQTALSALEQDWKAIALDFSVAAGDDTRKRVLERLQSHLIKRRFLTSMLSDLEHKLGVTQ